MLRRLTILAAVSLMTHLAAWVAMHNLYYVCANPSGGWHEFFGRTISAQAYGILAGGTLTLLGFSALPLLVWCAVAPVLLFRVSRRAQTGLCLICGYDLRATPGRCPECGTVAGQQT